MDFIRDENDNKDLSIKIEGLSEEEFNFLLNSGTFQAAIKLFVNRYLLREKENNSLESRRKKLFKIINQSRK